MLNVSPYCVGSSRRRVGFTLIELLVTMVIGVLLIAFLFQFFKAAVGAWQSGENQNDTFREARAAMQLMERDISQTSAALPRNAYASPWPSPSATPVGGGTVPVLVLDHHPSPDPTPSSGDEINEELYCLTNIPNSGTSSLCAVGYFCMWMPDLVPTSDPQYAQKYASAPHAYALVRQFLGSGGYPSPSPSTSTVPAGLAERFYAARTNAVLSFTDIYDRMRPPTTPPPTLSPPKSVGTELASFVWDLQFRTPTSLQSTPSPALYGAAPSPSPNNYLTVLPPYVEIRFKALSAGAARQLEGNAPVQRTDWNDTNATTSSIYQRLILPGARQFVLRVPIASGSATSTP